MKKPPARDNRLFSLTHSRWLRRVSHDLTVPDPPDEWFSMQCRTCAYFVPLSGVFAADWGVCANEHSARDGRATFEHDGCEHWEEGEEPAP